MASSEKFDQMCAWCGRIKAGPHAGSRVRVPADPIANPRDVPVSYYGTRISHAECDPPCQEKKRITAKYDKIYERERKAAQPKLKPAESRNAAHLAELHEQRRTAHERQAEQRTRREAADTERELKRAAIKEENHTRYVRRKYRRTRGQDV